MKIRGQRLFLVFFLLCFSVTASASLFSKAKGDSTSTTTTTTTVEKDINVNVESGIKADFGYDPSLVISDETASLSFSPPASDISVIFLGNLFGLVDGVLHGSGSQIMGIIFNVFNSAILAMGGVVMMYIIIVSTMNTAHEGQMLGQKWSSIWVPVRATMGLALLIPKSSGYCLMQIFVMWVVVQGVGIADKVWGTALDYLNRGGVIMQAQVDPTLSRQAGVGVGVNNENSVIDGAGTILYGQVCMQALQVQLENQRKLDLEAKKEDSGPCAGEPSELMQQFCNNSVPDFIGSVDPLNAKPSGDSYSLQMPNFDSEPYDKLNGVCGTLRWDAFDISALTDNQSTSTRTTTTTNTTTTTTTTTKTRSSGRSAGRLFEEEGYTPQAELISDAMQASKDNLEAAGPLEARATIPGSPVGKVYAGLFGGSKSGKTTTTTTTESDTTTDVNSVLYTPPPEEAVVTLSASDFEILQRSRVAAISQMYTTLASTARTIVANDPEITPNSGNSKDYVSAVADYQFGVPQTEAYGACLSTDADCPYWGKLPGSSAPLLLDGTELQDAVTDFNAVMQPALKLLSDAKDKDKARDGRAFIKESKRTGWILAGSYFFHLARLNDSAIATSDNVDSNSGLGKSTFSLTELTGVCEDGNVKVLCDFFGGTETKTNQIKNLFTGPSGVDVPKADLSNINLDRIPNDETISAKEAASTVYGYANNAMLIDLPGQSGLEPGDIGIKLPKFNFKMNMDKVDLGSVKCTDRKLPLIKWRPCIGAHMTNAANAFAEVIANKIIRQLDTVGNTLLNSVLILPLKHFSKIFEESLAVITTPGTNPVLALAVMGVKYINMSMDTWMGIVLVMLPISLIPYIGSAITAFIMMVLPLFMVWIGIMVGIGYTTAYYIPFLPYMIFTFGALAWFIAVVEAMAAAPLVALGISHPEGHDALGKSEQGLMILLNVFLRPAMMVIGFIASIAMCYVGVWLLNSGFSNVIGYLKSGDVWGATESWSAISTAIPWASMFGAFFVVIIYTMIYLTLVEKSFSLIAVLPDKVLRWVGGQAEGIGQEASQWTSETKQQVGKAADAADKASGAIQKGMAGGAIDVGKGIQKGMTGGGDKPDVGMS
ncbi:MAG: type IVB secretion system protein DotA [Legionellaceae bacterium]|nr:type IVB secretion system protein DotA [Legionellaceae bacterium]